MGRALFGQFVCLDWGAGIKSNDKVFCECSRAVQTATPLSRSPKEMSQWNINPAQECLTT